jgi:hypothetical protein
MLPRNNIRGRMDRLPEPCPWARRARRARLVPRSPGAAGSGVVQAYRHAGGRPTEPSRSPGRPRHATGAGRFAVDSRGPCRRGTPPCAGNPGLRLIYIGGHANRRRSVRSTGRPRTVLTLDCPRTPAHGTGPFPWGSRRIPEFTSHTWMTYARALASRPRPHSPRGNPPVAPPRRAGTLMNPSGRNDCS